MIVEDLVLSRADDYLARSSSTSQGVADAAAALPKKPRAERTRHCSALNADRVIYFMENILTIDLRPMDKALCEQAREKLKARGRGSEARRANKPMLHLPGVDQMVLATRATALGARAATRRGRLMAAVHPSGNCPG